MNANFHFSAALNLIRQALARAEIDIEDGDVLDGVRLQNFRRAVAEFQRAFDNCESLPDAFVDDIQDDDADADQDEDELIDDETSSESWSAVDTDDEGFPKRPVNVQLDAGKNCSICTADYRVPEQVRVLPCRHYYHVACIDEWFKVAAKCPLCNENYEGLE